MWIFLSEIIKKIVFLVWSLILTVLFIRSWWIWLIVELLIGIGVILIFEYYFVLNQKNPAKKNHKKYLNKDFDFQLRYPENYELTEEFSGALLILSPKNLIFDIFKSKGCLDIVVNSLKASYYDNKNYLEENLNAIKNNVADSEIITSEETTLNWYPAYKIIYTKKVWKANFKILQMSFLVADFEYVFIYTNTVEEFEEYFDVFNGVIESFKFLK